ncbi:hypothetical protein AAG906_002124 [Vitis piasezkii]
MEAHLWATSCLVRGECLASLSGVFMKGCRLSLGEAPEDRVAPLEAPPFTTIRKPKLTYISRVFFHYLWPTKRP